MAQPHTSTGQCLYPFWAANYFLGCAPVDTCFPQEETATLQPCFRVTVNCFQGPPQPSSANVRNPPLSAKPPSILLGTGAVNVELACKITY